MSAGPVVVRLDPDTPVAPSDSRKLSAGLGEMVGRTLARTGPVDLVLTGGETARRVLDALGGHAAHPAGADPSRGRHVSTARRSRRRHPSRQLRWS